MTRTAAIAQAALAAALVLGSMPGHGAEVGRCLTADPPPFAGSAASSPSVVFVSSEERRPLAAGTKLVLVRGTVPAPGVEALAAVVEQGYRLIVGELGFSGFPDRIALSLRDLPPGSPGQMSLRVRPSLAEISLSRELEGDALVAALAHQIGHIAAPLPARGDGAWWAEATAGWIAARLLGPGAIEAEIARRLSAPERSFASGPGASTWVAWLASRHGASLVRRIGEDLAAEPGPGLVRAMSAALAASASSLERELEGYAAWLVAEARRRGLFDAMAGRAETTYPAEGGLGELAAGLGAMAFLRFDLADVAGGLEVQLGAASGGIAAVAVAVPESRRAPLLRAALATGEGGERAIAVPSAGMAELVVVAIALGATDGQVPLEYRAATAEDFPYALVRLQAEPRPGAVRVEWVTGSERDVHGWTLLRAEGPGEPLRPAVAVLIPSASQAGATGSVSYSVLDGGVEAGRTYYYAVEAVTREGFPAPSHVISVSVPAE